MSCYWPGIKDVGGATIVYRTRDLRDPAAWRYDGMLCTGEGDTGEQEVLHGHPHLSGEQPPS